jgi:hypothetical protein
MFILNEKNRAMTRGELAEELERRGTPLPNGGKDARAKYVGTILWRNGEIFENHKGTDIGLLASRSRTAGTWIFSTSLRPQNNNRTGRGLLRICERSKETASARGRS